MADCTVEESGFTFFTTFVVCRYSLARNVQNQCAANAVGDPSLPAAECENVSPLVAAVSSGAQEYYAGVK